MIDGSSCTAVPGEVTAWVDAGRAALGVGVRAAEWDAGTRRAVLADIDQVERLATALRARVVTAEREAGTWSLRGDRDLAGFLGRESRQGRGAGSSVVGQAETLSAMPAVADALVGGSVTPRHLQEIARATAASPRLAAELATSQGQAQVVEMARRWDGSEFGRQLTAMSASLDPAARQRSHDEQRAERSFAWTHTSGGTLLKGRLDSVAGHKLAKVIEALCPRPALDDERTREQRQADALVGMVDRVAVDRATTPGAIAPVQAVVTLTQETWAALRAPREPAVDGARGDPVGGVAVGTAVGAGSGSASAASTTSMPSTGSTGSPTSAGSAALAGQAGSSASKPSAGSVAWSGLGSVGSSSVGSAADLIGRLHGVPPVVDETDRPWPASEIGRALCDCALTRAVVGAFGEPLDLGRGERLFQRQHWLALYGAGVRTCAFPGCGMPLRYTELHHLRWWYEHDGRTDIANCAPYCSYHHHEIHRLDIRVTRLSDGTLEHRRPDGRRYGPPPSGEPSREVTPVAAAPGRGLRGAGTSGGGDGPPSELGRVDDARSTDAGGGDRGGGARDNPPPDLLDLLSA